MANTKTIKNQYEVDYRKILKEALAKGVTRKDRTGVGCKSIFSKNLRINVSKTFPMITGRKMFEKTFKTEFEWFVNGETNIKRFQEAGIKIWDAWADENGDLGPVYGHQLRNYNGNGLDQLKEVITKLKKDPDSRRHVISLWNPLQIHQMKLPPCYLYFQFFVENGKLNLFALQRSGDLFLGIPYDVALFTTLLFYVAEETGLKPNILDLQIIDAHVYSNQEEAVKNYLQLPIFNLPKYEYNKKVLTISDYEHGPVLRATVAV
jgi:thymidylate synthase